MSTKASSEPTKEPLSTTEEIETVSEDVKLDATRTELIQELNLTFDDFLTAFPDSATIIKINRMKEIAETL